MKYANKLLPMKIASVTIENKSHSLIRIEKTGQITLWPVKSFYSSPNIWNLEEKILDDSLYNDILFEWQISELF